MSYRFGTIVLAICVAAIGCDRQADIAPANVDADSTAIQPPQPVEQVSHADVSKSIQRASDYLLSQQQDDGSWRSTCYGGLKDGAGTTSLVVFALSHLPARQREQHREALNKAIAFLQPGLKKKGAIAAPDGTLDYPTYSAAMLLIADHRVGSLLPDDMREQLLEFLLSAQLTEQRGYKPESRHYGGWDLMGATGVVGMTSGTNTSISSFALEALSYSYDVHDNVAYRAFAANWIVGCITSDGGMTFHPDPTSPGNKALWTDDNQQRPRSYGTATADGLHCLFLTGFDKESPEVEGAISWLADHEGIDLVPGFEDAPPALQWQEGLRYYYAMTLSKCLQDLPSEIATQRRRALDTWLLKQQASDGSWQNDSSRMREDDPLIATSFALISLEHR